MSDNIIRDAVVPPHISRAVHCQSVVFRQQFARFLPVVVDGPVILVEASPEDGLRFWGRSEVFCQQDCISRRYAEEIFMQCGLVPNIVAESESTQSIIRLVSHGMGFSLLPEIMVQREIQDGLIRTIPLRDAQLVRTNYIVWHKDKYLTKIMQEIISWKNESDSAENTPNQA